ncbi:hypothetical protein EVAR_91528_1 [Eumeta japonica]|uniref:Uncharacterized protein n=1 Tax=Eumeta variegata TaxID=151549 RepID=A0A4C1VCI1_EUMVA|nr:hypothetical protein EVAR_91528_1 [Eumeta japonica]
MRIFDNITFCHPAWINVTIKSHIEYCPKSSPRHLSFLLEEVNEILHLGEDDDEGVHSRRGGGDGNLVSQLFISRTGIGIGGGGPGAAERPFVLRMCPAYVTSGTCAPSPPPPPPLPLSTRSLCAAI